MAKMNYNKRGNAMLVQGDQHEVDGFDHYYGPFGSDVRMSIAGAHVDNRDHPGGDGPVEVLVSDKEYKGGKGATGKRPNLRLNQGEDY